MLIECILRRENGVVVTFPIAAGMVATYHFKGPFPDGPQVAEVMDPEDIGRLLAITEGYRVYQPPMSPEEAAAAREKAIEADKIAQEAAAAAQAKRLADEAEAEAREIKRIENLEAAAHALLTNKATIEEARTIAAGEAPAPAEPEAPSNPSNALTETQAAAQAHDAAQVASLKAEAEARDHTLDDMTDAELRDAFTAKFNRTAHPHMKRESLIEKLGL